MSADLVRLTIIVTLASLGATPTAEREERWGAHGHELAARSAVAVLPSDMPRFFVAAADRLAYLNAEPDRWRVRSRPEMRGAWAPDHYVNLENLPPGALEASDRYGYLAALRDAGLRRPEQEAGFLPFRILELYQRVVTEWELWRAEADPTRRAWIEDRIIEDAGLLGHYVTDGSQPHHTTIHFNGWAAGAPNPQGFTTDRTFHSRFETAFVDAHVTAEDVAPRVGTPRSVAGSARQAVLEYVYATHAFVEQLYRLDRDSGFSRDAAPRPEALEFAADRLAAGAQMLATLWLSAWEESR